MKTSTGIMTVAEYPERQPADRRRTIQKVHGKKK